jgi:poly(hydroxyalkanoate) depolymerase family esterase
LEGRDAAQATRPGVAHLKDALMSILPPGFGQSMREALRLVRGRDPLAATRVIRQALSGAEQPAPQPKKPISPSAKPTPQPASAPRPTPDASAPGEVVAGQYAGAAGARAYRLYVPSRPAAPADSRLVLMLHGCTQDPDDFALGTRMDAVAEKRGWHVLYPAQTKSANFNKCWNWFSPNHQTGERGEPAILAAMTREIMAGRDIRAACVAGLSAGGAMALIMGDVHPELFDAVLSHSGIAAGGARDLPSALAAMKSGPEQLPARPSGPRLMIVQGADDRTVVARNADVIENAVETTAAPRRSSGEEAGRKVERRVVDGADGKPRVATLRISGLGHAWSGGAPGGSFVDPQGPNVSEEFARFVEA